MKTRILQGDCRTILPTLPANSVHCVVTSPPYYGLRDYGTAQWEGGNAGCDHKGAPSEDYEASRNRAERYKADGISTGQHGGWEGRAWRSDGSRECRRCGARRIDAQLGFEASPDEYIAAMVGVLRDVRRVMRPDATLWLNMGDGFSDKQLQMVAAIG